MTGALSKSTRLSAAFGGFLTLVGILFAIVCALAVLRPAITEVSGRPRELSLMVVMGIGILDVIAGIILRRG